ncbi:MAG: MATE family efflux transporter, partial [Clostridia bacterium]|nr:MATE family efflux transporter [Clostridia bacterium]
LCGPLATIFFAMDNYLRISGFVKTSMFINIGCNLATLLLLTFFLLVCKMDVVGSALATSLSMCACSLVAMYPFLRGKTLLKFTKPHFHFAMIKQIVSCGSPIFLSNVSGRVTSILMNIALMTMGVKAFGEGGGTTAVAVYAVLMYASDFCWPLLYGVADSLAPSIGYNWGAKQYDRVKKIAGCAYVGTAVIGLLSTSVLFFFSETAASLFVNAEETRLLEISTHAIRIFCLAYLFRWMAVTTQSLFTAIEKPLQATVMAVAVAFVFPVALLALLQSFGLDGIWFNFVGVNALAFLLAIVLLLRLRREIGKKQREATNI